MEPWGVLLGVVGISVAYVLAVTFIAIWRARRRYVVCPENGRAACLRCSAGPAVAGAFSETWQRVIGCSRWPEKEGCDRDCERGLGP
jgi:hypothetical protein